uniref:Uncharacterized protein n=1 Tax=Anopheles darlingi TaxID=43151 RepID=A0A2M4DBG8_ANODA
MSRSIIIGGIGTNLQHLMLLLLLLPVLSPRGLLSVSLCTPLWFDILITLVSPFMQAHNRHHGRKRDIVTKQPKLRCARARIAKYDRGFGSTERARSCLSPCRQSI